MSNVILGIMGVVLFIGLAMAGTVWIGPEFMSASADTQATRLVSETQQVVYAFRAYKIKEGQTVPTPYPANLVPTYLKSVPLTLDNGSNGFNAVDMTGAITAPGSFIITGIYPTDDTKSDPICRSIVEYTGQTLPTSGSPRINALTDLTAPVGCFRPNAAIGALSPSYAYVYGRI